MANVRIVTGAQGAGFTGPAAASLKTVNVLSTGATGTEKNVHKQHNQVQPAAHKPGVEPTYLLGPTGTKGIPTLLIPGFTGPA